MYNNFLVRKREKDILSLKQIVFFSTIFFLTRYILQWWDLQHMQEAY